MREHLRGLRDGERQQGRDERRGAHHGGDVRYRARHRRRRRRASACARDARPRANAAEAVGRTGMVGRTGVVGRTARVRYATRVRFFFRAHVAHS